MRQKLASAKENAENGRASVFGYYGYFNNVNSSILLTWDKFPFIYIKFFHQSFIVFGV